MRFVPVGAVTLLVATLVALPTAAHPATAQAPTCKGRDVTILGPWDSKPEDSIYSYQSEFAQRLLGSKAGERITLAEGPTEIVSIAPWTDGGRLTG